jgi:acyl-CoA thioesterase-1
MLKIVGIRIVLIASVLFSLLALAQPARAEVDAGAVLRIMPFGDSITTSVGDHFNSNSPQASYRYWLDHDLHNAFIPFEFMGTQTDNYGGAPKYPDFDHHHEGHSGYTTALFMTTSDPFYMDKILSAKRAGTTEANIPDIVLLHMGSNDVFQGVATATSMSNLGKIIDKFRGANPNVVIFLAEIIPCAAPDGSNCGKIATFNAAIPALAASKTTTNSPVIVVDQYTGFDATAGHDTYDGVHPVESGEKKMSAKWLAAIQAWWNLTHSHTFIPTLFS